MPATPNDPDDATTWAVQQPPCDHGLPGGNVTNPATNRPYCPGCTAARDRSPSAPRDQRAHVRPALSRCPVLACPVRYRSGPDRLCTMHIGTPHADQLTYGSTR